MRSPGVEAVEFRRLIGRARHRRSYRRCIRARHRGPDWAQVASDAQAVHSRRQPVQRQQRGETGVVELFGASGKIAALMGVCGRDLSPAGIRDAALIAVLYGAGLRRSESVGLDLSDYNIETGELAIRGAKGRKDRLGYATNGSADALKDWLVARGGDRGPLFCNINKSGRVTIHRLTDQAVIHVLKKRAVQASVASFSPHDLRRSFISDLLDAGADISTAQQLAGHSNVQTTAR